MTAFPGGLVNLTMPLREGIAAYPSHGRSIVELNPVMRHSDFTGRGRYNRYDGAAVSFEVSQWLIGDQAGTHMDAPFHADADSPVSIDQVPLEACWGPAVKLDCRDAIASGGAITVAVLREALAHSGVDVRRGDIVLLQTGASAQAGADPDAYVLRAAGLDREAAEWLRNQGAKLVGIDAVTIESPATAATADAHTVFLRPLALGLPAEAVIAVVENLVNLDQLPASGFEFWALPLPLVGAAGSPVRAVARLSTT